MQISRILSFSSARVLGHTRFLSSTARESAFPRLELPELPPPALATPFGSVQSLTQADFRQYVRPLCQRNWLVFMERPNLILSDHSLARSEHTVPMLGKKFWFLRGRAAVEFLADVVKIAGQEEHEPRISLFLGRTKQHVLVRTYTLRTLGDTEEFLATNVVPGLSTRDLRLALLFETHFQEEYVGSEKAWPLREMLEWPRVPSLAGIRRWQMSASRVPETPEVDEKWTPLPSDMSPLPSPPDPKDAGTICTDEHFDAFLRPLYMRGWLAAFMPILGKGKLYAPTLCLTRFFTFVNLAAATSFIRDVVAGPWYKEDNVCASAPCCPTLT
ncbi:hypothetical protein DFH09DRAFT_1138455 [Mycena vulgaris]|nr:hypothetical protein DFH09DRAFT_1138455 [Mycena vulgaris]